MDTNGEVVTAGDVAITWNDRALVARHFIHGDLIGRSPFGLYELTGAGDVGQGQLHYRVHDATDPNTTPPGIMARFRFKVGDGSIGTPDAESGDYTISIVTATLTDDRTPISSDPNLESRLAGASYETFVRNASVVVRVAE